MHVWATFEFHCMKLCIHNLMFPFLQITVSKKVPVVSVCPFSVLWRESLKPGGWVYCSPPCYCNQTVGLGKGRGADVGCAKGKIETSLMKQFLLISCSTEIRPTEGQFMKRNNSCISLQELQSNALHWFVVMSASSEYSEFSFSQILLLPQSMNIQMRTIYTYWKRSCKELGHWKTLPIVHLTLFGWLNGLLIKKSIWSWNQTVLLRNLSLSAVGCVIYF